MIPGSNLLRMAMGPIAAQMPLQWRAWLSSTTNEVGDIVDVHDDPVDIVGSMQPVNRTLYHEFGLDMSKEYQSLFTSSDVRVVDEDRGGDVILWDGHQWLAETDTNWRGADGWRKVLCVRVRSL